MVFNPQQINTNGMDGACSRYEGVKVHAGCKLDHFEGQGSCAQNNETAVP